MRVGIWFYGLATIITGILDLVWGAFEASHQPIKAMGQHITGERVLAYIAGVWMVAAGTAILSAAAHGWERRHQQSSTLSLRSFGFPAPCDDPCVWL
jgi:hypothetical protein